MHQRRTPLGLPVKDDEIERRCCDVADDRGQQAMNLTAMMRLMVKEMVESRRQRLFDINRI